MMKLSMRIILVVAAFLGALVTWQWQKPVAEIPAAAPNAIPEIPRASAEPARVPEVAHREQEELPPLGPFATEEEAIAAIRERTRKLASRSYCYNENGKAVVLNPNSVESREAREAKFEQERIALLNALESSNDPEQLFAYSVFLQEPEPRLAALQKAIARIPDSVPLRWFHFHDCAKRNRTPSCDRSAVLADLRQLDPHNAETWLHTAAEYYAEENHDEALAALQHASVSETASLYWFETVEMLERGMSASDMSFEQRSVAAIGIAAAMAIPGYSDRLNMCRTMAADSSLWAQACLDVGATSERNDVTLLGSSIGLALQSTMAEYLPNDQAALAAAKRYKQRDQDRRPYSDKSQSQVQRGINDEYALFSDADLWYDYVSYAKQNGELAAQEFLEREVERMRATGWQSPCEKLAAENAKLVPGEEPADTDQG